MVMCNEINVWMDQCILGMGGQIVFLLNANLDCVDCAFYGKTNCGGAVLLDDSLHIDVSLTDCLFDGYDEHSTICFNGRDASDINLSLVNNRFMNVKYPA